MKKLVDDQRLIFKCCSLYYEDGLGQKEICDALGISRPTVSRMLSLGKQCGIVKIEVRSPVEMPYGQMERQLEKFLGLQEVVVVPTRPIENGDGIIDLPLGNAVLKFLCRVLRPGDYVGVSMGLTIQNVLRSECFIEDSISCTFVPLVGGVSESRINIHSNYLAQGLAERFGGKSAQFLAPALFSSKNVLQAFLQEEPIQHIMKLYNKLDLLLMGIGATLPHNSTIMDAGYVSPEIMENFIRRGAVGDISLRFFDINGNVQAYEAFNERVAGMSLDKLGKVPRRIGVAAGADKVRAVLGAIRGGFVNILITDEACAQGLLVLGGIVDAEDA